MLSLNRAFAALVCALTMGAAPAVAQSLPEPLQVRPQIDERGVDLVTQNVQLAGLGGVSIGPDGPGGLSFSRLYRTGGWRNSTLASVSLSGTQALVSIGDSADAFEVGGFGQCGPRSDTFSSLLGLGTTLQVTYERDCEPNPSVLVSVEYVYTDRNGVIYSFIDEYSGDMLGTSAPAFRPVSGIAFPTGEVVTFHYRSVTLGGTPPAVAVRLQGVTNNLGYAMHFDYARNGTPTFAQFPEWRTLTKVTAFDSTVVTDCAPLAETCTIPGTWPWVAYTGTEFRVDTATDALGRTTTFS